MSVIEISQHVGNLRIDNNAISMRKPQTKQNKKIVTTYSIEIATDVEVDIDHCVIQDFMPEKYWEHTKELNRHILKNIRGLPLEEFENKERRAQIENIMSTFDSLKSIKFTFDPIMNIILYGCLLSKLAGYDVINDNDNSITSDTSKDEMSQIIENMRSESYEIIAEGLTEGYRYGEVCQGYPKEAINTNVYEYDANMKALLELSEISMNHFHKILNKLMSIDEFKKKFSDNSDVIYSENFYENFLNAVNQINQQYNDNIVKIKKLLPKILNLGMVKKVDNKFVLLADVIDYELQLPTMINYCLQVKKTKVFFLNNI